MKNCALLLFYLGLLIWSPSRSQAQSASRFGNNFNFDFSDIFDGQIAMNIIHIPDTAIGQVFVGMGNMENKMPKSPILLGVKLNPDRLFRMPLYVKTLSKSYLSYFIPDGSDGLVVAMGINKNNIADYRYRVVENDSTEIVPWSKIPKLEQNYGAKQPYGFIGRFQAPGKLLLVEVKNVNDYSIREGVIFDWRTSLKPTLQQIAIFARRNGRLEYGNLKGSEYAKEFDPKTNIPTGFKFKQKEIEDIQLFFNDHFGLPYTIAVRRIDDKNYKADFGFLEHEMMENSYMIYKDHFDYPGEIRDPRQSQFQLWPPG
jgi:two-component system LytT family sensor kinase